MLYYNPEMYFDCQKYIDWKKVIYMQKKLNYPIINKLNDFTKT